jgi:hypothetical protein
MWHVAEDNWNAAEDRPVPVKCTVSSPSTEFHFVLPFPLPLGAYSS